MTKHKLKSFALGVDPGFKGAIAITDGEKLNVIDMPLKRVHGKNYIDEQKLAAHIKIYEPFIRCAIVEDVGAMTGNETPSKMFRFGYGAGIVNGILVANGIPVFKVKPAVWKSKLGMGRNKAHSVQLAAQRFPKQKNEYFKYKKDDGRAEAALIACEAFNLFRF